MRCRAPVCLIALVAVLFWIPVAFAQSATDEANIHATISKQLDALKIGDGAAAFAIASPNIQTIFQDAPTFMAMVERGYPQVVKSTNRRFLKLENVNGALIQRVLIESEAGNVIARYEMVEIDNQWRINGCAIERGQDV